MAASPNSYSADEIKRLRELADGYTLGDDLLPSGMHDICMAFLALSDGPSLPLKPTMGMWDDFCEIFPVTMKKFEEAFANMVAGLSRCPLPIQGDDGSQEDCIRKGHCGCVYGTDATKCVGDK